MPSCSFTRCTTNSSRTKNKAQDITFHSSGSLVYWEYRQSRTQRPTVAEWGAVGGAAGGAAEGAAGERPPRLVAALVALHAELGVLPWPDLLQPALAAARDGFPVSAGLAAALEAAGPPELPAVGSLRTEPGLAAYLASLQLNTSLELTSAWGGGGVRRAVAAGPGAGAVRVYGGSGAAAAQRALDTALRPPPADVDDATRRVVAALQLEAGAAAGGGQVASGLAVVDTFDTYVALVTGLSAPFGSGPATGAGWTRDEPAHPLDLAPAILADDHICGTRYVVGAESTAALAQVGAALAAGAGARAAVERARVGAGPAASAAAAAGPAAAAVNLVRQAGDELLSYADTRGGGIASRF